MQVTIARMILTAIYNMLSIGEVWNPCDFFKIDMPEELKAKQEEKASAILQGLCCYLS